MPDQADIKKLKDTIDACVTESRRLRLTLLSHLLQMAALEGHSLLDQDLRDYLEETDPVEAKPPTPK